MTKRNMRLAIALAVALVPKLALAQDETHQMPGMQAQSAELTQCLRVQPAIQNVITAAMARAEAARLSNTPTDLRAALDHLEGALRDIRAQSEACATAAASSDPHAGHTMTGMQSPSSTPAAQPPAATSEPHAGHTMPATAPAAKTTASNPEGVKPAGTQSTDPHAGHAGHEAAQAGEKPANDKQMDPVNGLMVDPATAPQTSYQGQTYYFSSEQSKKEFLENPDKFAKKPKG
jgi:YHS domain-containing protein